MSNFSDFQVEWFVMGAAAIMLIYHTILYLQQKDKFLLLYSNYLLSVVLYLVFRRVTGYDSFTNTEPTAAYFFDHPLILYMLFSYVYFIARVLDIYNNASIVKFAVVTFYYTISIFFIIHVYKIFFTDEVVITRTYFLVSKSILLLLAFIGLSGAFIARKTTFIRIIILGGVFYASFSLLTVISVYFIQPIFGLYQYQLYFIGCLIDILLFSSALGYRSYLINQEKVTTQKLLTEESEKNKDLLQVQHSILQKENRREQAIATMNKHLQDEVGASLSSIHVFADLSAKIMDNNPEKSKEYLQRIANLGQRIMDDIGDIIWLANLNEDNLHEALITRIKNYYHEILIPSEVALDLQVAPEYFRIVISEKFVKDALSNIKNEMKNAVLVNKMEKLVIKIYVIENQACFDVSSSLILNQK